jgi:hypothetical protein
MIGMWRHLVMLCIALPLCGCAHVGGVIRVGSDPPEPYDPPFAHDATP